MHPVHAAPSSPRASQEAGPGDTPSSAPAQPGLSQRQADNGVRRFFEAASLGSAPAQPGGQHQARAPVALSEASASLPPSTAQD